MKSIESQKYHIVSGDLFSKLTVDANQGAYKLHTAEGCYQALLAVLQTAQEKGEHRDQFKSISF
jgi:hypothetical protein